MARDYLYGGHRRAIRQHAGRDAVAAPQLERFKLELARVVFAFGH